MQGPPPAAWWKPGTRSLRDKQAGEPGLGSCERQQHEGTAAVRLMQARHQAPAGGGHSAFDQDRQHKHGQNRSAAQTPPVQQDLIATSRTGFRPPPHRYPG